jgi:stage II sporulation protein D
MGRLALRGTARATRLACALLALAAAAGCGDGKSGGRAERTPPHCVGGPGVEVRLAAAGAVTLVLPPGVDILDAGGGPAGEMPGTPGSLVASLEGDEIRLGAWRGRGPVDIRPGGAPLGIEWLRDPAVPGSMERRTFRGSFRIAARTGGILLSNRLTLEEYLAGVVGAEMPASSYPMEALKAQAVASRTYALYSLLRAASEGRTARFAADESFQVYAGRSGEHRRVLEAVAGTAGEVLTYRGGLFRAYFHSTCGGRTVDASRLFGEPVIAPLGGTVCGACEGSAFFRWEARAVAVDIERALAAWAAGRGVRLGRLSALEVSEATPEGRAAWLAVRHEGGSFEVTVERFRALLHAAGVAVLKSAAFTVRPEEGGFRFEGGGFGHGAGLCQVGAGRQGGDRSYREILAAYYPGSEVGAAY